MSEDKHSALSCQEPWCGVFCINIDRTVKFCPCYLSIKIGKIDGKNSLLDVWNSDRIRYFRRQFIEGKIPPECLKTNCDYILIAFKNKK